MPELRIENGTLKGTRVNLPNEGNFIVGSDPKKAQLALVDENVDKMHSAILCSPEGKYSIKDLGSPKGTLLNQEKVSSAPLKHGDKLQIGATTLSFLHPESVVKAPPPPKTPAPKISAPATTAAPTTAAPAAADPMLGKTLGGYRIEAFLGKGGMGTVYKAVQISLDRVVALKILSPHLVADKNFVALFFKEARAAANLNHPNVVHVYDVGSEGDLYFYSLELMEKGTVEARLQREGKIPVAEAIAIIRDAARGLQFAESRKIVHRDIKPDNLMISAMGIAKIADLGLAAGNEPGTGPKGKVFGTPHFISPEQARGEAVDSRSDLYSLGATFYRILTGKTPFSGKDVREIIQKQLKENPTPVRSLDPEIPEEVEAIIAKLMQKDPANRYASAKDLGDELDHYLASQQSSGNRLLLYVGAPLLVIGISLAIWRPWASKEPQIVEKIVEKQLDPAKIQENERMKKELLEKNALIAYQSIPSDLSPAERATSLEKMASNYPATESAKKASQEAATLREKIEAQNRLTAEKQTRLAELEKQLRARATTHLENQKFAEAANAVATAPEAQNSENEDARQISEKILEEIRQSEASAIRAQLDEGKTLIASKNLSAAEEKLQKVRAALQASAPLPESLAAPFKADLDEADRLMKEIVAARESAIKSQFNEDLNKIHDVFQEDASWSQDLANLRFKPALEAVQGLRQKVQSDSYKDYLSHWNNDLQRLEKFLQNWVAHVESQELKEKSLKNPINGKTQPLAGASLENGPVVQDFAKKEKVSIPWGRFDSPEKLYELLNNRWAMSGEELCDLSLLLLVSGVAQQAKVIENTFVQLRADKAFNPTLFDEKVFQFAKETLQKAEAAKAPAELFAAVQSRLQKEQQAAALLNRALQSFSTKRFEQAALGFSTLKTNNTDSLIFALLSDGSSHLIPISK